MPPEAELPWLEYSGQPTDQVFACKQTHRIDSLLCVLEEGLLLRQSRNGKRGSTSEERILLAVMALDREVNNGGYHQFFCNSSRQYVLTIVAALSKINMKRLPGTEFRWMGLIAPEEGGADWHRQGSVCQ